MSLTRNPQTSASRNFDLLEDPEVGSFLVPDRLWSVPLPYCFGKVQMLSHLFKTKEHRIFDLSIEAERIDYYERALVRSNDLMLLDSVDGLLLMQGWPRLNIPDVVRQGWQPAIDTASVTQDTPPRDPGGLSSHLAEQVGLA